MFDCVCPLPECRRLFPPLSSLLRGSKEGGERKKADNRKKRERERRRNESQFIVSTFCFSFVRLSILPLLTYLYLFFLKQSLQIFIWACLFRINPSFHCVTFFAFITFSLNISKNSLINLWKR